jgi:hypothetical protein
MLFGFAALLLCTAAPLARGQAFTFQTFAIAGTAPGPRNLGVQGLNDFGATSGNLIDTSNNDKGWVRDGRGNLTIFVDPLDTVVPTFTVADHNNDLGAVVGEYYDSGANEFLGFFYFGGKFNSYAVPGMAAGGDDQRGRDQQLRRLLRLHGQSAVFAVECVCVECGKDRRIHRERID